MIHLKGKEVSLSRRTEMNDDFAAFYLAFNGIYMFVGYLERCVLRAFVI